MNCPAIGSIFKLVAVPGQLHKRKLKINDDDEETNNCIPDDGCDDAVLAARGRILLIMSVTAIKKMRKHFDLSKAGMMVVCPLIEYSIVLPHSGDNNVYLKFLPLINGILNHTEREAIF